ncbi:MAG: hypothetical protein KDD44_10365, partial [Bdellovibrionales bacterium]|nr:hypothetical protein [Bdellovibrionales bacterium]
LEKLRSARTEDELMRAASQLPADIIDRDALVVMTTAQSGVGKGVFYSATKNHIDNRLLELVCKHNKIICGDRSVQARSRDDMAKRSFLSVPFHVLGRDAGSLNLLSRPNEAFAPQQISLLEKIAACVGRELERIRLRERYLNTTDASELLSWRHFVIRANLLLKEANSKRVNLSLVRIAISNLAEIEDHAGVDVALATSRKIIRLVEQLKRQSGIACCLYGTHVLLLVEAAHAKGIVTRLRNLVGKLSISDVSDDPALQSVKLGDHALRGMHVSIAEFPEDGETIHELCSRARRLLENIREQSSRSSVLGTLFG